MLGNPDIIPIISLSNKDGTNIDNMHKLLYCLPSQTTYGNRRKFQRNLYRCDGV